MVHVRGELPWLRSGPLFRVHVSGLPALDEMLERHSFHVLELDGRRMTSRVRAHSELARVFDFPDYYGKNWDAFNDCFGDFVGEHDGERIAVVWHHLEVAAEAIPATAVEVGWAMLASQFRYMPSLAPGTRCTVELNVFAVGEGTDFDRP